MSSAVSTDWPIILPSVVEALNEMPQKKLRNFSPSEINNKLDDTKVHNAQKTYYSVWGAWLESQKFHFRFWQDVYEKRIEVFDKSFFSHVNNSFLLYSLMQTSQV